MFAVRLTLLALVVLEGLEGGEGSTTSEQLVAELGLVVGLVLVVDLVVLLLGVACMSLSALCHAETHGTGYGRTETEHLD